MLTVFSGENGYPLANDDYYVRELASGLDELVFQMSLRDPMYKHIVEEARIRDRDENIYIIKQIDAGNEQVKVVAQIDIDDFKSIMYEKYSNNSATVNQTVLSVLPAGWACIDHSNVTIRRTIPTSDTTTDYNVTAWKVLQDCCNVYGVRFRFNSADKIVTIINPKSYENVGAFATRDLNLRELNYKGKSTDLCTRLYAEGADGLTFATLNDGKNYVEDFTYTDKVISAYWKDERYTDAQSLLDDARAKLAENAIPQRSYDCDVLDLASTNPDVYGFENFSLFNVITLIDDAAERRLDYQIVERWNYPYYPARNKVVLSTATPKIQNQVVTLMDAVSSPTSTFQQMMQSAISNSTALITGNKGGYVVLHDSDDDGEPDEILIMDTPSIATATKVWRWNKNGLGYSSTGYNGTFGTAITADGSIVADFITAGTLNGGIIRAGSLDINAFSDEGAEQGGLLHSYTPYDIFSNIARWQYNAKAPTLGTVTVDNVEHPCLVMDGTEITQYTPSYQVQFKSDYVGTPTITVKFKYKFDRDITIARQRFNYFYYKADDSRTYTWWDWIEGTFEAGHVYTHEGVFAFTNKVVNSMTPRIGFYFPAGCITSVFDIEITGLQGDYMKSTLSVSADGLNTLVQKGDIISSINQSAESVTINANKIDLTGNLSLHGDFESEGVTPWGTVGEAKLQSGMISLYEDGKLACKIYPAGQGNYETEAMVFYDINTGNEVAMMGAWASSRVFIADEKLSSNTLAQFWGDVEFEAGSGSVTSYKNWYFVAGTVYNSGGGAVFSSDKRKKKNIKQLVTDKAKAFIMALKPKEFKFKEGTSDRKHHGFIAQEVKEAMTEDWGLYVEDKETDFIGLRYDEIIADLVAVVQDQEKRIEALERTLNDKSDIQP